MIANLLGKYQTPAERVRHAGVLVVVFIIYIIIQTVLFVLIKQSVVLSFFIVPLTIAGWLLGTWAPLVVAPFIQSYIGIMLAVLKAPTDPIGPFMIILPTLIGMGLGRMSDLTYRTKQSEAALLIAKNEADKANKAKSEFLASISHEIRTPMNSIIGFATLLKEEVTDIRQKDKVDIILKAGDSLMILINDLLDISRIEAGRMELMNDEFAFSQLLFPIENMFALKAREKHLKFTITLDHTLPALVMGDERRIQQILINLAGNAIKFTHSGEVKIHCSFSCGKAVFRISDTGIGIAGDKQQMIFDSFRQVDPAITREYGGTGLGLAISRRLADLMHGSITLESVPGEGSVFTLEIPLPVISAAPDSERYLKPGMIATELDYTGDISRLVLFLKKHNQSFRILVAEDNELNREYAKQLLKTAGVAFDFAVDGRETLDLLQIALSTGNYYDLLLLDIRMPGMSGLDVIRFIRSYKEFSSIYVIAVTAHAIQGDSDRYLSEGCNFYIAKPINKNLLFGEIYKLILEKANILEKTFAGDNTGQMPVIDFPASASRIANLITKLKSNCELFDVSELKRVKTELEVILPSQYTREIGEKMTISIHNYDDEMLKEIIKKLEQLV